MQLLNLAGNGTHNGKKNLIFVIRIILLGSTNYDYDCRCSVCLFF